MNESFICILSSLLRAEFELENLIYALAEKMHFVHFRLMFVSVIISTVVCL